MSPPSNSTPTHLQLHQKEQERKFIERQQVQVLLENYNLSQYYNVLIEEGFDRLESLFEVTEKDLVELCVKRGHRRLLQRAIHNAKGFPPTTPLHINVDPSMSTDSNNEASFRSISTKYDTPYEYDWHLGKSIMTEHDMVSYQRTITSPGNTRPNSIESSRETRGTVATAVTVSHTTDRSMKTTNTLPNPSTPKEVMTLGEAEHCSSTALPYRHDTAVPYHLPSPMSSSLALSNSHAPLGTGTSGMSSTEDDTLPSDGTGRPWKRKYQRHAKPDRNSPVKPASAYVMFSNRVRDELRSHNMSFTELAKLVGDRWKNLNQKEKENYEVDAMQARMHYQKMLEEYQKTDEFKKYQTYTSEFKEKHEAADRPVGKPRKRRGHEKRGQALLALDSTDLSICAPTPTLTPTPTPTVTPTVSPTVSPPTSSTSSIPTPSVGNNALDMLNNLESRTTSTTSTTTSPSITEHRNYPYCILNDVAPSTLNTSHSSNNNTHQGIKSPSAGSSRSNGNSLPVTPKSNKS